jgi:hypothetical protein
MGTYFVASNLTHDGKEYKRGDRITLADEVANPLVDAGVIQIAEIEVPEPAQEPEASVPQAADVALVGGQETTSGEPSLDGTGTETTEDATREVSPAGDISAEAPEPAQEPAQEPEKPKRSFFGRKSKETTSLPAEPLKDPSVDL